jgi:hypothetical protein
MGGSGRGENEAAESRLSHEDVIGHQGEMAMTTPPSDPRPRDPAGLAALISRAAADRRLPPVERWSPPHCGAIDMAIDGQGRWS